MPEDTAVLDSPETTQTPETTPTPPNPPSLTDVSQIPQDLRNKIEAQHKRGLQQQLQQAQTQLSQLNALKDNVAGFMGLLGERGIELGDDSDLSDVAGQISGTLDSLKTEKEKAEAANRKVGEQLEIANKRADQYERELHDTLVLHQLNKELAGKARSPKAAELIAKELRQYATVGKDKSVTFEMDITDENDHTSKQKVGVKEAVNALIGNDEWSDFFVANVNSGAGGDIADDVPRMNDGLPDLGKMAKSPEGVRQFMEMHEKNPALLEKLYKSAQ